ncbi:MAG: hypothetical protein JNL42_17100, partial [Anaerolineae bacterium]|nr:hypothetical protein [Anaerolineae bacterium]
NVVNSTVSGNSANGGGASGGGGAIDSYGAAPVVNFYSSTIAFNTAAAPNALKSGFWQETGTAFFANTIIANNNGANNCSFTGGTRTSIPNNIDNGTTCGFTGAVGQNTNPLLGALGNNGGPTQTHLPANTSPAVNAGDNAWAVDEANVRLSTDQRRAGYPRINSGTVDIGAVEVILPTNNTLQATLLLQGRTNPVPHPSYVIAARVRVMPAGGGSPFIDQVLISDSNGIATLSNVPLGTYLFSFKGSHTLARQVTITIAAGTNSHTTEVLLEGDATDNNTVNISDFSLLAAAFGSVQGGGTYDARTDFNGDNAITISDFSLLAANFSQTGAGGVTP